MREPAAGEPPRLADDDLTPYLRGVIFPAMPAEIARRVRENGADPTAVDRINLLPPEKPYRSSAALIADLARDRG